MGVTQRFGLTTLDEGKTLSSDGGKFGVADRRVLDRVLAALEAHNHTGGERLADPSAAPSLAQLDVGGLLPGSTTFHYRIAYVDQFGLETAPSAEASITTPGRLAVPGAPVLSAGGAGTLPAGTYYYALTTIKDGYSTPISAPAVITIGASSAVQIDLPALPLGGDGYGVWRQGPSESYFTKIAETDDPSVVDDGAVPASDCPTDPGNLPPMSNRTNSSNVVTITAPAEVATNPLIVGWRIYRTTNSGSYTGASLVADVRDIDPDTDALVTSFDDVGNALLTGTPKSVSQTLQPSTAISGGGGSGDVEVGGTSVLSAADGVFHNVDIDGEDNNGPDRFRFRLWKDGVWRMVAWFNEFGEFRLIPSAINRTALRVFGALNQTEYNSRSASNPIVNIENYRDGTGSRETVWALSHNGSQYIGGDLTVDGELDADIGVRIAGILDHDESPPGGTPTGAVFLRRPGP